MKIVNGEYKLYLNENRENYFLIIGKGFDKMYVGNYDEFIEVDKDRAKVVISDYNLEYVSDCRALFGDRLALI